MSTQAGTRKGCGCHTGHGNVVVERNRYFTGKFMTARDCAADTEYLLSRHQLHNRLLHGWGIVCGLEPSPHPRPECARNWVVVSAGFAIDCYGRELVLECDTPFRLPLRPRPTEDDEPLEPDCEPRYEPFLLCAKFHVEEVEPVPALYAEGTCDPHHTEFNRYREGVRLVVADVTPGCWPIEDCECGHHEEPNRHKDRDCDCDPCCAECLTPHCPCADLVPLARVIPLPEGGYRLDLDGRRVQPPPPALLTHITGVNWPHGGRLSLDELRDDLGGELRIRFDRPLRRYEDCAARGVNPFTLVVQYGTGPTETVEFLPYPDDSPPRLDDERCTAVFTIDPDYLGDRARRSLHNVVIYVSLRCDFIPDCRGIPVDGNHLRGKLPSGDGVQGGLFESWFEVCDDDDRRTES